ncbi:carboxypeptidase-like regulatory domain-containing protein [Hymenobacter glacieicola]|uniref:SD-repeat containing protein B domain-containing protein n=1 Tax=Hymenobacter glacieicola TaxID=1562124 RepID=A0ABQ1WVF3_9BACT|nr:carboxypeptidase-like regulatory domain-containing protein [Hymenobacter glacieicola]GGG46586.1 hypothetical protein GCM10011378_23460 [Hymenobacter glacieicola]
MQKFTSLLFSSICAASLLTGCTKSDDDEATPSLTGNLYGFVNPLDELGSPAAKSGVTVTLDGVTPAATVTTDANGRYEFANLKAGTYNLTYSRPDLGTYRRVSVGHVGGNQPTFAFTSFLTQPSSTRILNPTVSSNSLSGTATLQFTLANAVMPSGSFYRYHMYVGATPNVTAETGTLYANTTYGTSSSYVSQALTRAALNAAGLPSGRAAYVVVYGLPNTASSYTDPTTGRIVYTGLGAASNTVAFIVP